MRSGLTEAEATARLAAEGFNELPSPDRHSTFSIVKDVVREPMFGLLIDAAALYSLIGDLAEAAVLSAFATVSISIAIIQRGRSERVLDSLRDLSSPRALVIRDGVQRRIAGREVARGDLLIVTEGDRIPADATLLAGDGLQVDESMMTGESVAVHKHARPDESIDKTLSDSPDISRLYAGTLVIAGTGQALVTATGPQSEVGQIGGTLSRIEPAPPRLQQETRRLVVIFAAVGLVLSASAVLLYGALRGDWLQALLGGIALGMSMLPEEFPLVLTVFMVMGAWRLSQSRVLTRRPSAIETLGAATVLCTDKTGTLTLNTMSVTRLLTAEDSWDVSKDARRITESESLSALLQMAALASEREALDPMDRAIFTLAAGSGVSLVDRGPPVQLFPLRPDRLAVTHVYKDAPQGLLAALKGAPECIGKLCRMTPPQLSELTSAVDALATQGVRVLAVARGGAVSQIFPESPEAFELEYLGLIGLADPLRPSVPEAVRECRSAGVRVVMITGDYPETARAIARQAGIGAEEILTGSELDQLADTDLARRASTATVYARITPRQKLRIVQALQASGEVVAMTGDGVNDSPALKAAHIGVAMGARGTDVAREASAIVLLDDDFGSIVRAIRLGRRIYDNLRKAMGYILAIHVPIAGLALLPLVAGGPLVLTPILIAFLELIIDPACSVVLEAETEELDVMKRPPRHPKSALLTRRFVAWSLLQGLLALIMVAGVFAYALQQSLPHSEVRSLTFFALVGVNIALIFANRSYGASWQAALCGMNGSLRWGLAIVLTVTTVILAWPTARAFLQLGPLHLDDLSICFAAFAGVLVLVQLSKLGRGLRWRGAAQ